MEVHEAHEKIEEAGHVHGNKGVAILITLLAALLAICEMGGKSAQHTSLAANIEAANLWAFFQAKTIRQTVLRTADQVFETLGPDLAPGRADHVAKRIEIWRQTVDRYESEPSTQEGRKELADRAKVAEQGRDRALAAYHLFEYGSASFQLAIVLASASIITAVGALVWVAGGLGLVGAVLSLLGWFAPTAIHL